MTPSERIKRFKDYLALHQTSTAFARLAEAYADSGNYQKALELLERGVRQHPGYLPAHILRANYLLELNHPFKAEEALREAITIDPANPLALRMLLELELKREAAGRGMTAKKLASINPGDPLASKVLSEETQEPSPFTTRSVAELYESQGYLTEALRIYKEVIRQKPDDEDIKHKIEEIEERISGTKDT